MERQKPGICGSIQTKTKIGSGIECGDRRPRRLSTFTKQEAIKWPEKGRRKPDLLAVMEKAKMDLSAVSENRPTVQLRCPFHEDHGRPNFTLWRNEQRWRCFRCGIRR